MIPLPQLAKSVHAHIFQGAKTPSGIQDRTFSGGLKAAKGHGFTFIEQNKATNSDYAKLAKSGHSVSWVIKDIPGQSKGHYVGAVIDGVPESRIK
jgi:uncharacterized protein (DUF2147 family)